MKHILFRGTNLCILCMPTYTSFEKEKICDIVKRYGEIDHIDKITSKSVGNKFIVIVKVSVDGNMTVNESHDIAGKLKAKVMELKDVYDVIVHITTV